MEYKGHTIIVVKRSFPKFTYYAAYTESADSIGFGDTVEEAIEDIKKELDKEEQEEK